MLQIEYRVGLLYLYTTTYTFIEPWSPLPISSHNNIAFDKLSEDPVTVLAQPKPTGGAPKLSGQLSTSINLVPVSRQKSELVIATPIPPWPTHTSCYLSPTPSLRWLVCFTASSSCSLLIILGSNILIDLLSQKYSFNVIYNVGLYKYVVILCLYYAFGKKHILCSIEFFQRFIFCSYYFVYKMYTESEPIMSL